MNNQLSRKKKILFGLAVCFAFFSFLELVLAVLAPDLGWKAEAPMVREQIKAYLGKGELWSDEKEISLNFSIYRDDFDLLWRIRPGLDVEITDFLTPPDYRDKSRFRIRTNSSGFRMDFDAGRNRAGRLRIACLGDSHTFGWGLDAGKSWPSVLRGLLSADRPDAEVEVLNLGQPGFSSAQGILLLREMLETCEVDVAVFGFGFNDNLKAMESDSTLMARRKSAAGAVAWAAGRLRTAKLLACAFGKSPAAAAEGPFGCRRVPAEEYSANLLLAADECRRRGTRMVFLSVYNGYRKEMELAAETAGAGFVDADEIARGIGGDADSLDSADRAEAEAALAVFGAGFLEANPKYLTHSDAAHYNSRVHLHVARAVKAAISPANSR